jgi:hypothetical protein
MSVLMGHNSAATAASKPRSGRRAIPVRTATATTGSVDRNVGVDGPVSTTSICLCFQNKHASTQSGELSDPLCRVEFVSARKTVDYALICAT